MTLCRARLDAAYDDAPDAFLDPTTSARAADGNDRARWKSTSRAYKRAYVGGSATYQTDIPQIVAGSRNPGPAPLLRGTATHPAPSRLAYCSH